MMYGMHSKKCKGALLLVFGVLFLLGTTGVWPEFTFDKYWPVILIVVGLHDVFCSCMKMGMKGCMGDCCGGECRNEGEMHMKRK